MTDDFYLYLSLPGASPPDAALGRVMIRGVHAQGGPGSIVLDIEFFQEDNLRLASDLDHPAPWWVTMNATIKTNTTPAYVVGEVDITPYERPAFRPVPPNGRTRVSWTWRLTPEAVERIEEARIVGGNAPVVLAFAMSGSVQLRDGVYGFHNGSGNLTIAASEWEMLLDSLGFTIGPTKIAVLGQGTIGSALWREAEQRLAEARRHLRAGNDYDALDACLSELEAIASGPYRDQGWKALVDSLPDQKAMSIARWFSGFATYLNRVGHHRDREERSTDGDLQLMPLNHWEAELAVAAAHFVLAYALHLR